VRYPTAPTVASLLALLLAALALTLAGCAERDAPAQHAAPPAGTRLTVVATTGMVADLARNIAGDRAEVSTLLGPGVDPHLYKPTRSDIAALAAADVVFYSGLLLEGKMTDALVRVASSGRKVHAVTELLDDEYLLEPDGLEGHPDPHVWMDPVAWARAAGVVRDKLIEADPAGEAEYRANAERYLAELAALHEYARQVLSSVPERSRVLVTAHDAFNYFGRRYGYDVMGIQGISTESEAGVRDIQRLVDTLVERDVKAVFVESTVADRNIRALIAGAAARGHAVAIGGELFSDAMGPAGTYEGTYIGMIDHNVTTIARALGGTTPDRGMNGRLAN